MPDDRQQPGSDRPGPNGGLEGVVQYLLDELGNALIGGLQQQPSRGTGSGQQGPRRPRPTFARTPSLDRYGRDLTADAEHGGLDPVIGRDAEIEQVLEVLARRTKNNPVLIGDPGVGKTAIAEGVAQRIAADEVPDSLRGARVVALDIPGMVAGTKYRGEFEQRLTAIIREVSAAEPPVVLFVDEIHNLVGAGSAQGAPMDAGNILKPALARGELHMMGATTAGEYRKRIESDPALERRFEPIRVAEPTPVVAIEILRGLRVRYETHHNVRIDDEALIAAVELSARYMTDRFLPDKAVDLIDRAGAKARLGAGRANDGRVAEDLAREVERLTRERDAAVAAEEFERARELTDDLEATEVKLGEATAEVTREVGPRRITAADIADAVARATGIPVAKMTRDERSRLLDLEVHLHRRVIGQDDAVEAVADAVRAGRAGLTHPNRPIGSFLFLGPTGVGKTELARALADTLFDSPDMLLRFDMSEYADKGSALRLTGAPPGHVGYEDAGQLTEAVRRTPYAVLLLDEIEKAHSDVTATLLQVLDAGRLTDSHGRTVDFSNTVIIMTSNIGAGELLAAAAAGRDVEEIRDRLLGLVRLHFRPEFLGRIDETVLFHALDRARLRDIAALLLSDTVERLAARGIGLTVTPAALDWLVERGHQPELGARPLRRTISREVDRRLSRLIIAEDLAPGSRVRLDIEDGNLVALPEH
ncbi:ATP-dependent Clp protease ATP-binding subunit [Millisia brevis]|uniref:ATP-dependent Clp protease ATP-binding subunit n=1 Tax=Millisia brevis TaxID=264148 RepID=UPI0008310EB7|nr:ATP-dependent Clp protease ATP-binding subunit [Millisia brevis]